MSPSRVQKRHKYPTRTRKNIQHLEERLIETVSAPRLPRNRRSNSTSLANTFILLETSTSVSDSGFETSDDEGDDSDSESGEQVPYSAENVVYHSADDLSRKVSLDSRYDPENEDYELDDFVVADDETEIDSDAESDETLTLITPVRRNRKARPVVVESDTESDETPTPRKSTRRVRTARRVVVESDTESDESDVLKSKRGRLIRKKDTEQVTISKRRLSSIASTLSFISRSNSSASSRRLSIIIAPTEPEATIKVVISCDAEEISDAINDAIALYSRRCNHNRPPTMFVIDKNIVEEEGVQNALADVMGRDLMLMRDGSDYSEFWVVGPKTSMR
jgi:hypothetical protein